MANIETVKDKAEQLKSEVGNVVGQATESLETQARGVVDGAKGTVRTKVADIKDVVDKEGKEARSKIIKFRGGIEKEAGQAIEKIGDLVGLNQPNRPKASFTSIAIRIAVVAVLVAIVVELARNWPVGRKAPDSWVNKSHERAA